MEERRLLLAIALSLLVLTAYSLLFSPATPPAARRPAAVAPSPVAAAPPEARPVLTAPPVPVPLEPVADVQERRVEVVAPSFTVAFTNRGARLISWTLGRYRDARGRPEEMVPPPGPGARPLDIETEDKELDSRLREALFRPSEESVVLGADGTATLRLRYAGGDVVAEKTLTFRAGQGVVGLTASVRRGGRELARRVLWGPGVGNPTEAEREVQGYQPPQGVALVGSKVERYPTAKLATSGLTLSAVRWAGVESHYFTALFIPAAGSTPAELRPVAMAVHEGEKPWVAPVVAVPLAEGGEPLLLYVGAKDYNAMRGLGHDLARVVPVGDWIGPIVVPLMGLLEWVHGRIGNYGWSIVLLTVLINLAMAPFRHYSIVNGLRMAKLSPEMRTIQERYRKVPLMDPRRQQMQEEMQALYAKHGMSMGTQMMVGCLPLMLTMPFLFAFYRVLTVSIELRGAPFLWIPDLAQKDPFFVTPVLMGVSMFAMQKMTPSTLDPAQQRIMMLMPVMLTGMFLWAPSGLNVYWLTSNLFSILQQAFEKRFVGAGTSSAAARRRA